MSHPKSQWWGYVKSMVKRYPNETNENETRAVLLALEETSQLPSGSDRIKMVELIFLKKTHTIDGVALKLHYSADTIQNWHADFIRLVGAKFSCNGL